VKQFKYCNLHYILYFKTKNITTLNKKHKKMIKIKKNKQYFLTKNLNTLKNSILYNLFNKK